MPAVGETDESLREAGFTPCGELLDEGNDDEDGSICPPLPTSVRGGGLSTTSVRLSHRSSFIQIWSHDKETSSGVGFACAYDITRSTFYAKLETQSEDPEKNTGASLHGSVAERAAKGAITTLLDVAETYRARKITMGLGEEHTACAEFVCSLLYLGFQVVPSRKSPLVGAALLLDFEIGLPVLPGMRSSDNTCTGTSDCSTSADEDDSSPEGGCSPGDLLESD